MKKDSLHYSNKNLYYYHTSNVWDSVLDLPNLKPKHVLLTTQLKHLTDRYTDVVTLMSHINTILFQDWKERPLGERPEA